MSLNADEAVWFEGLIEKFNTDNRALSDWQVGFFKDQETRYEQYGDQIRFSDKQWVQIDKISEALGYTSRLIR